MAATQVEDEHAHIRVDPPVIGERTRGRNRSESFAADDDLMISEIDAAVGNDSSATGSQQGSSAPAAPAASSGPKKQGGGQLSRRTLKILNSLEPEGPPGANRRSGPLDDALLAEALLAEEEAAAAASASSGVIRRASVPTTAKTAPEHDMVIKILLLGDGGVGKTSLLLRYADNTFSANMMPTAGVAFKTEMLEIQGKRVKFQIWDTAGQDRFHVITQAYYKGAHGIVLVYDVSQSDQSSFQNVQYWMENITKHATPNVHKCLVGNKRDMPQRAVSSADGEAAAEHFGVKHFECSAKNGHNVEHVFHSMAADIVKTQLERAAAKAMSSSPDKAAGTSARTATPDVKPTQVKHLKDGKDKKCCIM